MRLRLDQQFFARLAGGEQRTRWGVKRRSPGDVPLVSTAVGTVRRRGGAATASMLDSIMQPGHPGGCRAVAEQRPRRGPYESAPGSPDSGRGTSINGQTVRTGSGVEPRGRDSNEEGIHKKATQTNNLTRSKGSHRGEVRKGAPSGPNVRPDRPTLNHEKIKWKKKARQ